MVESEAHKRRGKQLVKGENRSSFKNGQRLGAEKKKQ